MWILCRAVVLRPSVAASSSPSTAEVDTLLQQATEGTKNKLQPPNWPSDVGFTNGMIWNLKPQELVSITKGKQFRKVKVREVTASDSPLCEQLHGQLGVFATKEMRRGDILGCYTGTNFVCYLICCK